MSGDDESNDRKQIWLIRPNCLVRKDAVTSGMTRNSRLYICSKSCIPMFDTAATLEESVIAACVPFLPPVFDDSDMTWKSSERLRNLQRKDALTLAYRNRLLCVDKTKISDFKRTNSVDASLSNRIKAWNSRLCEHGPPMFCRLIFVRLEQDAISYSVTKTYSRPASLSMSSTSGML